MTTTNATPIRIDAEHYQIPSLAKAREGAVYDIYFNHQIKKWQCSCYDAVKNDPTNCKHVRRLRQWIQLQMSSSQVQREASEIISAPSLSDEKIASMEAEIAQHAEMIRELKNEVERLQIEKRDKRKAKTEMSQEELEAAEDREAWEEFERDPAAGRARQAEKVRQAALNQGNEGFSILRK